MKTIHRDVKYAPKSPRLRIRDFFADEGPRWLDLNPLRLGFLGGVFFGWLDLLYYVLRTWSGVIYTPQSVVLGVARTFLAGYAAVGLFVCYLLWVAQRELPEEIPEEEKKAQRLTSKQVAALESGELTPDMLPKEVLAKYGAEIESLVSGETRAPSEPEPEEKEPE